MVAHDWQRSGSSDELFRVEKKIKANRKDEDPSVIASMPGRTEDVCEEIAKLVKQLIVTGKVENDNQIAFLFPSLKTDKVESFKKALEKLDLKVYAPRAGRFIEVDEAVDVFGVYLRIFGKPTRGDFPGQDYNQYFDWIEWAYTKGSSLIKADKLLAQFVKDRKEEIEIAKKDYEILLKLLNRRGWQKEQPYQVTLMKRALIEAVGLSERARRNIGNRYFDRVVETRQGTNKPVELGYAITRATSIDWNVLDLFYRLCTFDHFKAMFDLAETGKDEGPFAT